MLFVHPFSSCCQKALIALYERATPLEFRMLGAELEKRCVLSFVLARVSAGSRHLAIDRQIIGIELLAADPGTADWTLRAGGTEVPL